jgi:dihydrofolate reductase
LDELRLMVYPVVLGAGTRLFGETQDRVSMRLVESRPFGEGVVNMTFTDPLRTLQDRRRARAIECA